MNKLLPILFLTILGCSLPQPVNPPLSEMEGGALVQGSRAWKEAALCNSSWTCIRAQQGPFWLEEIRFSDECPNELIAEIKHEPFSKPRFKFRSFPPRSLVLSNLHIKIKSNESLYVGGAVKMDGRCYVSWSGFPVK